MTDQELAAWARSWHWNDCAEDRPVDLTIYPRDMRMLKAFLKMLIPMEHQCSPQGNAHD